MKLHKALVAAAALFASANAVSVIGPRRTYGFKFVRYVPGTQPVQPALCSNHPISIRTFLALSSYGNACTILQDGLGQMNRLADRSEEPVIVR